MVLLKTLLEMVTPKPHEELEREGLLVSFRSFMGDVIFVSHQWTGLHHPDSLSYLGNIFTMFIGNLITTGEFRII